LTKGSPVT